MIQIWIIKESVDFVAAVQFGEHRPHVAQDVKVLLAAEPGNLERRHVAGSAPFIEGRRDERPISPRCRHSDRIQLTMQRLICLNDMNCGTCGAKRC
jgi:hypothetical protein